MNSKLILSLCLAISLAGLPQTALGNTQPQFAPNSHRRVISPGEPLSLPNAATDSDAPAQGLSYQLLQAPQGAGIEAGSGLVSWVPSAAQAGTSNLFRVVVMDDGVPPQTATNDTVVFVRPSKPNIVIIVTDDQGWHDISAHGCEAPTPNWDRLGTDGIRLERFYPTPVCSVTRSTLLTGRNPIRTGVNNTHGLDLHEHLMPVSFKAAGYQTFMCGKWHLGGLYNTETNALINGVSVPVIRENVDYQPQNRGWDIHYGEYTGAINYLTHISQDNAQLDWWLNGKTNLDSGWSTDLLADQAVRMLQERDPSKPVVLYLAFNAVHGPISAPAAYLNKYASVADVRRRTVLAALDQEDEAMGRVLSTIDSEGIRTNTLVVCFSDNGGDVNIGSLNTPLRGTKTELFEGGIHTPAAIRWPGVLPSGITNSQQFVWVGDLFPTLCAAAGVTPLNTKPFDGVNLWPLLLNATNGPFNPLNYRGVPLVSGSSAGSGIFGVFSNGAQLTMFKLIHDRLPKAGANAFTNLLFDIIKDPFETTDLAAVAKHAPVVSALIAHHDSIKAEVYPPYIGVSPQSQRVPAGTNVTLWAMATVYPKTVAFQWRKDGVNIPGATNRVLVDTSVYMSQLSLASVTQADAASYDVVVTDNAVGWPSSASSLPATLSVDSVVIITNAVSYDVLLGRPTDSSIAVSLLSSNSFFAYVEYGTQAGLYPYQTQPIAVAAGIPAVITLGSLLPDQAYVYRVRSSATGSAPFSQGIERRFQTQRAPGRTFTFVIEADPHHRDNEPAVWQLALNNMLADRPDFLIDLGDTFMDEKVGGTNAYYLTKPGIFDLHREVRTGFFSLLGHSVPSFLVDGNHEAELGWLLSGTDNPAVWGAQARQFFFPVPAPDPFYSGASAIDPYMKAPRDGYYAFEWGDALFVALDPFWYTPTKPKLDGWGWTLGAEQYFWLKETLEGSKARFKFVFAHHLIGGSGGQEARGGASFSRYFEWGGYNTNGSYGFAQERPDWPAPIQDLLVANKVQAFFHGHDHLFVKEDVDVDGDGVSDLIYQEVPQPSRVLSNTNSATAYGYTNGVVIGNSGHLRVTVSPTNTLVEYVRVVLPANETATKTNRMVSYQYNIPAASIAPGVTSVGLPDTGQTSNYGASLFGVDSDYTINPPSYKNNGDGTTTDNITGLVWQRVDGGEMTWESAIQYAATNTLGGVVPGTWRLPSIHELAGILVYNRENPAVNTNFFLSGGSAKADYWWSRDTLVTDATHVWEANAGGGVGPKAKTETLSAGGTSRFHARLVRGPALPAGPMQHHLFDNGDNTISDLDTGLIWQKAEVPAAMTWTQAITYAESLNLGGAVDWRLPNIKELESLNDEGRVNPSMDTRFFPGAKAGRYWSSTTQNNRSTNAWWNEFAAGITSQSAKSSSYWVRAVRGPFFQAAPVLSLRVLPDISHVQLTARVQPGHAYSIQASSNLSAWFDLFTTNALAPLFLWEDEEAISSRRFYRVVAKP